MILKEFSDWQKEGLGYKKISQDDSSDEQIIKGIYNTLKYMELELSWDILCDEPYVDILDAYDWLEKQGEKTTEKVGPKFKVGDYAVQYNSIPLEVWKVINIDEDGYYILQHITCPVGDEIRIPAFTLEKDYYKADGMFWRCL